MKIIVNNFAKRLDGTSIKVATKTGVETLKLRVYNDASGIGDEVFFMSSDGQYNANRDDLRYVFYVHMNWDNAHMNIGLARKGAGTNVDYNWGFPFDKSVLKTPDTFLAYLTECLTHNPVDIMSTYKSK